MILLAMLVISGIFAYWGMTAGLQAIFGRCLLALVAVAAGVGFGGPLRSAIPADNPYLYGSCLFIVAVLTYALLRTLANSCLPEPSLVLPLFVDRLGGAVGGFLFGLVGLSYLALTVATIPLPDSLAQTTPEIRQASRMAVGAVHVVGAFAGTDEPIRLETILPRKPDSPQAEPKPPR